MREPDRKYHPVWLSFQSEEHLISFSGRSGACSPSQKIRGGRDHLLRISTLPFGLSCLENTDLISAFFTIHSTYKGPCVRGESWRAFR